MRPDKCGFCKGKISKGKTEFVAKVGNELIPIKGIPAYICEGCGEAYYLPEVPKKIDKIMREFHESKLLAHPIQAVEIDISEIATN